MKKICTLSLALTLAGCASTDYSEFDMSTAALSNIVVKEKAELEQRKHEIQVSFDYVINGFHADENLYHCSVQFLNTDGTSMTSIKGRKLPCRIDASEGNISINWPSPLDKSRNSPKEVLSTIKYPVEYFVAIHQKTGVKTNNIIGKSDVILSKIKI
ncbi:hypothetical protein [Pseudoalteromonas sp. T1lg75]|uniref:hypothetical protein n=1 Tax=Pseudoalteromonas sp. T1lg75 TaxID=2077102 RepID=UPI000CF5E366|nr:hypothetical protein [Pseudoalteromonas sp. T1lg75]